MKNPKTNKRIEFENKTVIILGSEGKGISPPILKKCDDTFKIALIGKTESLNVSVASGIIMHEISKQNPKENL